MTKKKYYMQYTENNYTCSIELITKTDGGARKIAKTIAREEGISYYEIMFRRTDGFLGQIDNNIRLWG